MYNLGEHFNMNLDRAKANKKCIFKMFMHKFK